MKNILLIGLALTIGIAAHAQFNIGVQVQNEEATIAPPAIKVGYNINNEEATFSFCPNIHLSYGFVGGSLELKTKWITTELGARARFYLDKTYVYVYHTTIRNGVQYTYSTVEEKTVIKSKLQVPLSLNARFQIKRFEILVGGGVLVDDRISPLIQAGFLCNFYKTYK